MDDADRLASVVDEAEDERPIQAFIAANPIVLISYLRGGHGRWLRSQVRLGSQYVADFLIADADSMGVHWTLVELESPRAAMCLQNGTFARKTRDAMEQIDAWRAWITANRDYAMRPLERGGLGLEDVEPRCRGLVLVGRRDDVPSSARNPRRAAANDRRIEVHSYDWLVETVRTSARTHGG